MHRRAWWSLLVATLVLAPATASAQATDGDGPSGARVAVRAVGSADPPDDDGEELAVNRPVVGVAATSDEDGAWMVGADGGIFTVGEAPFLGSLGAVVLNRPIVGMAATPSGEGYWLVASDGGIFTFGDATFEGSTGGTPLNRPIVGMAPTPSGEGYWLVASDGGIFTFGDATFEGSTGGTPLNRPIVGMAPTPSGEGYWLVASDGGVFTFGDAGFLGSAVDRSVTPVVGLAPTEGGYATVDAAGQVITFAPGRQPSVVAPDGLGVARVVGVAPLRGGGAWVATARAGDEVEVHEGRGVGASVAAAAQRAATAAGGSSTVLHSGTLGLLGVERAGQPVQVVPAGSQVPMSSTAVAAADATTIYGPAVAAVLGRGEVVLGRRSADLRGAQTGDDVVLRGWDGSVRRLRVGLVAPADVVGGELVVDTAVAASFGFVRPSQVVLWGFRSRAAIDAALDGLPTGSFLRIGRSWRPPASDRTATTAATKSQFGEFSYRSLGGGAIAQDPAWASQVVVEQVPILGSVRCHRALLPQLRGALAEVEALGLAGEIDVPDTRRYGGCHAAREVRATGQGTTGGGLSRHAWGAAIDLNPSSNGFGARPSLDLRVVDVFRRWGFAWGGSFTIPDGMHFEWARPVPQAVPLPSAAAA